MAHHYDDTDYCGCGKVGYCTPRCPDPPRKVEKPTSVFADVFIDLVAHYGEDGIVEIVRDWTQVKNLVNNDTVACAPGSLAERLLYEWQPIVETPAERKLPPPDVEALRRRAQRVSASVEAHGALGHYLNRRA